MNGSRTASNRSLQWGEQIVAPVFESKNDYDVMYILARKLSRRSAKPDIIFTLIGSNGCSISMPRLSIGMRRISGPYRATENFFPT
jgi:anaerobic selenocysteine-containing dehydrogenase